MIPLNRHASVVLLAVLLPVLAAASGCSSQLKPPRTAPVKGMVARNRKPVPGVLVKFHPQFDIGPVKFVPTGETGPDGIFVISTGAAENGAPPGDYVVTLEKLKVVSDAENSGIETEVDEWEGKYADPKTTPFKATIDWGTNDLKPFLID